MPIPTPKDGEDKNKFMARCVGNETMKKDYPSQDQRVAVCMSKAVENLDYIQAADYKLYFELYGSEEEVDEDNIYFPKDTDYVTAEECSYEETEVVEWDVAAEKPGLWENIRKKKQREGKKYKPAKPGDPDRPDPEAWKKAQSKFEYKNPKTGQIYYYDRQGVYKKDGTPLVYVGKASVEFLFESKEEAAKFAKKIGMDGVFSHTTVDGKTYWMPGKDYEEFEEWMETEEELSEMLSESEAAEYQGRTVKLNKPFRTPDGPKKFSVYTKNEKGNVVKVNFGDPNMEIKKDIPERRRSFRARHNCDNPGPKYKARYWSCRAW